jgi:hypothetical protein
MKDKTGPTKQNKTSKYLDLERRGPHIPAGYITYLMLSQVVISAMSGTGSSVGVYGFSQYGRCIYGYKKGIYGADTYGDASYW